MKSSKKAPKRRFQSRIDLGWATLAERFGLLGIFGLLVAMFGALDSDPFLTAANWQVIISSQSIVLVIALGLMVPLIAGNFDLSVGSVAIMSSIVMAGAQSNNDASIWVAAPVAIAFGTLVGVVNGILITRARLNALIATLGTSAIIAGMVNWYTDGRAITARISRELTRFGSGEWLGVSRLAVIAGGIALVILYVLSRTPYGRKLSAIGSSKPAATLVGIRVGRVVFVSFIISGTLGGIAGTMMLAQTGSGNPGANGLSILLPALAAVYLGASTIFPGQFNVPGTVLGLLLVAMLVSGITLQGVDAWVRPVAIGSALIIAVGSAEAFRRQRL